MLNNNIFYLIHFHLFISGYKIYKIYTFIVFHVILMKKRNNTESFKLYPKIADKK